MSTLSYNTSKNNLVIPEYGRNIQLLIEHARDIKDPAYRQAFVEKIVDLMLQMHPQTRNVEDYVAKLWAHVFLIAQYDLDVEAPCEIPTLEDVYKKPAPIPYPSIDVRFRHYGRNVQELVSKASSMEDGNVKQEFTEVIGSYMKMAFHTWNDNIISDESIKRDLNSISKGELTLGDEANIDNLIFPQKRKKQKATNNGRSKGRSNNKNNNRKSNNNNGKRHRKKKY